MSAEKAKAARLAAARAGTPVEDAAAAERLELEGLLEERDTLLERHFAAREEAALLGIAAETAPVAELKRDIARARADPTPLEQAVEAEAARRAQADHLSQLEGIASVARQSRERLEDLLEGIVAGGVVSAEMF